MKKRYTLSLRSFMLELPQAMTLMDVAGGPDVALDVWVTESQEGNSRYVKQWLSSR